MPHKPQCSKSCGGGVTLREVQCFDMRDPRPLRPFHCQAISQRPRMHTPCNVQPCLEWYTSSWGQVSQHCRHGLWTVNSDLDGRPKTLESCPALSCMWMEGKKGQGIPCALLHCNSNQRNPTKTIWIAGLMYKEVTEGQNTFCLKDNSEYWTLSPLSELSRKKSSGWCQNFD